MSGDGEKPRWRRLWTAALALVWAIINVRAFDESDLFWHAAFGREIARQHARVFAEPFSFAATSASSQEWLWDLTTYLLSARFGWSGVAVLVIALAALAAVSLTHAAWEHRTRDDARPLGALILTTALVSPAVLSRIRERPETAAMVLLPLLVLFGHRLAAARTPRARAWAAAGALGVQLLYVQVHPSFLLGPVVVLVLAGPELALRGPHARRVGVALAAGFALAFATNVPALRAIWLHTGGYAVANVTDMAPPTWANLNPTRMPFFSAYAAIGVAALLAMAKARRLFVRPLLLALIGLVIALRTFRGVGPAAVLAVPLAMTSFGELLSGARHRTAAALLLAGYVLVRTGQWFDAAWEGGVGVLGLQPAAFPSAAARVLEKAPPRTRVLSTYAAGAPLAFELDGRVATFVDSRTPLVFHDATYGEARAIWFGEDALARATKRYGFDAAVVERGLPICHQLDASPDWSVAMVEPSFTTFVRRAGPLGDARPLTSFAACGGSPSRLRSSACKSPPALESDLATVGSFASEGFVRYLRAVTITVCSEGSFDADAVVSLLSPRGAALGFLAERDGLLAWVYAKARREEEVRALVSPHLDGAWGKTRAGAVLPALRALAPTASARDLFALANASQDDAGPGWLEAKLALACMADGDRPCVELHGLRAAALGAVEVTPALCWLAARGDDGARRWVEAQSQSCP